MAPLRAQGRGFDLQYGRWWHDSVSVAYTLSYFRDLVGPTSYSLGLTHTHERYANEERQTGGLLTLGLWRDGAGPYLLAGTGLGIGHEDGRVDAHWSAGAGYAVRPLPFLSLGIEAIYRVEDQAMRGFWRLQADDRRGVVFQARIAVGSGRGAARDRTAVARSQPRTEEPPSAAEIETAARSDGVSVDVAQLRAQVVETALDAMGAPYRWGGSDSNGFDCSGLIQYAYGEHGLILPRVSRDQARTGARVGLDVSQLMPGDILGFADGGGGVSHVGLYVGDGMFIHSSSDGVKLSSLTVAEEDARWWRERWVSARRVVN